MSSAAPDSAAAQLAAYRRRHQGEAGSEEGAPPPAAAAAAEPAAQAEPASAALVADLLPSPPASPAVAGSSSAAPAAPSTAAAPAPRGPVRVSQLRNRVCWICSEGDAEDGVAATPSSSGGSTPTAGTPTQQPQARTRRRRWIHPCGCSLIAHEACLRRWVRHSQARKAPVRCPQCVQPYELHERRSVVLALGQRLEALTQRALPILAAASAGSALLVAGTAYGCAAIRVFAGQSAARRMLDRKWPWHYYFDIPLIPVALIVARVETRGMPALLSYFISMHFPQLFTYLPLRGVGAFSRMSRVQRAQFAQFEARNNPFRAHGSWWPLPPSVTLVALPWIRLLYLELKLRVTRWVLAPHARRPRAPAAIGDQPRRRIREIVLTDGQPMVDVPGQDGVRDVGIGRDGLPRPVPAGVAAIDDLGRRPEGLPEDDDDEEDEIAAGADAAHGADAARAADRRLIYVTPSSLGRLVLGALALPFVGSAVGSVLAMLARRSGSSIMLRILGMRPGSPISPPSFAGTPSASSTAPRRSPFASLFYGGSDSSAAATAAAPQPTADSSWSWSQLNSRARAAVAPEPAPTPAWQEEDAVWLRSAIGAGLCIVAKDIAQLAYRAARLRQARDRSSLTVADKPFAESMRSELDIQE